MDDSTEVRRVVSHLREDYQRQVLTEEEADTNPIRQFEQWLSAAIQSGLREPHAMTVASCTPEGHPSARVVLLRSFDDRGFVFYTNYESRKGHELDTNPRAAVVFYWAELERQVRATGPVERVSREESEQYFHTRPVNSQLGAWASAQSTVIPNRDVLEHQWNTLRERFAGQTIPLPPFWGGYRVRAEEIEFWQGRRSRLHDRLLYTLDGQQWRRERLSP